jgi:hypothetical protein
MRAPEAAETFDAWHPREIAPLVAYLASEGCTINGKVFHVRGGMIACFQGWSLGPSITSDRPWTSAEIAARLPEMVADADRLEAARTTPNDELRRRLAQNVLSSSVGASS